MRVPGAVALAFAALLAPGSAPASAGPAADDRTIVHVLGRLAFGPRPADVARVRAEGLAAWLG